MDSILPYFSFLKRGVARSTAGGGDGRIDLPSVEIHNVETAPDKRPRTLKHLLRANHVNHSLLYHDLRYDNHMSHVLSAAYLLGANADQLHTIYDAEAKELEPWQPSPGEVSLEDWRDSLGRKEYQRAYVDFFEDMLALRHQYNWKKVVENFMFDGKEPMAHCLVAGLGHPLIHLAYAYEVDNKEVAMEALGLTAVQYNFMHKYLDDPSYTRPPPEGKGASSPLELLDRMSADSRLAKLFKEPSFDNLSQLFDKHEDLVLEYWNAWDISSNPTQQFQLSQEAAVSLLVATVAPGTHAYNFFTVHLLTTSHAVRVLLPLVPQQFQIPLVRQWWLLVIAVYASLLCPKIDPDYVRPGDLVKGRQWNYVVDKALNGPYATDAHFVKAVRAMKEAAQTWGDVHEHYLASAIRFVDDFAGWAF
ncbi:hypothetical protein Micbo1qcDRAFT_61132 [Microdochium bolleyi]|uniref:MGS207 protein n=1 Tax=Microdochium bolleyi TaxID=196109 RepID=A0A136J5B0_9PEZI|nr:hypothetical protein Micbo1qcDRAFT_61132 [Microdochium bolleyi]